MHKTAYETLSDEERGGSPRAIGFIFGMRKLEWLGYNLVKVI